MNDERQLDLFNETNETPDVPGLLYVSSFIGNDAEGDLLAAVDAEPWIDELRRRVQHYGYRYDYRARRIGADMRVGPMPMWARSLGQRLVEERIFAVQPDQLIVNEYEPGQGIAAHIDCVPCFQGAIASVSLGASIEMELEEVASGRRVTLRLEPGSLLVLNGEARLAWRHAIRPRKSDAGVPRRRRVSLTFRKVRLDDAPDPGAGRRRVHEWR
jgi:alkylated DNA repair dioxygenase AlkB